MRQPNKKNMKIKRKEEGNRGQKAGGRDIHMTLLDGQALIEGRKVELLLSGQVRRGRRIGG